MIMTPQSSLTPRVGTTLRGRGDLMGKNALRLISNSESQTEAFGREMGASLRIGDAVLLYGEMGAGKTCMARGIAIGAESEVSARSPTFIIVAEYPGRVRVFHCDLYRITGEAEVIDLALDESLDRGALVVEWPENAEGALPEDVLEIRIELGQSSEQRSISMSATGPKSRSLLDAVAQRLQVGMKT